MCQCVTRLNESLKEHNARIAFGFMLSETKVDVSPPMITLEKIAPRGKKPPTLVASFCPFCGTRIDLSDDPRNDSKP